MAESYSMVQTDCIFPSRHLSKRFWLLALAISAELILRRSCLFIMIFLDIQGEDVAQQCGSSVFSVSRTSTLFSIVAVACIRSSKQGRRSCFMHALAFLHSLWADCLVMAIVTDARKYLAAVLFPSSLKGALWSMFKVCAS